MNIEQSFRKVSPFAGLYFIANSLKSLNISSFINNNLPSRSLNAHYAYADIALSLFSNTLLQGQRLSDLAVVKQKVFSCLGFKIPSPDTVEYCSQELKPAICIEHLMNQKGKVIEHQHCYSPKMNRLIGALALKLGQLKTGDQGYTLDFDHMVIPNKKQDGQRLPSLYGRYRTNPCFYSKPQWKHARPSSTKGIFSTMF